MLYMSQKHMSLQWKFVNDCCTETKYQNKINMEKW